MTVDRRAPRARRGPGGTAVRALPRAIAAGLLVGPLLLPAATEAQEQKAADWVFTLTPYAFLPISTSGTSTIAGQRADIDLNLREVFENLNFAGAVRAEAWNGRLGVILDGYYTSLGAETRLEGLEGVAAARVDVESRQGWISFLGGYRVLGAPQSAPAIGPSIDLAAGVKLNLIDQEVEIRGVGDLSPEPGLQRRFGGSETFVEPQISFRGRYPIDDEWSLGARVDLSGFGVAGDNLQWLILAGAEWNAFETVSLRVGWQVYGIDFATDRSDGRFAYDVIQTGPYLGLNARF